MNCRKCAFHSLCLSVSLPVLGDPLLKGLTEVSNQRPEDPIIFLGNFLLNYAKHGGRETASPAAQEMVSK